jgi:cell wall-associated NlpC family hydrolase
MAQAFMNFLGVFIPRDADQQFEAGVPVEGEPQPGDLLYFQEPNDPDSQKVVVEKKVQSITHAAIYIGRGECIHSTGAVDGVTINSLDPASPIYRPWLREHLAGARRFR